MNRPGCKGEPVIVINIFTNVMQRYSTAKEASIDLGISAASVANSCRTYESASPNTPVLLRKYVVIKEYQLADVCALVDERLSRRRKYVPHHISPPNQDYLTNTHPLKGYTYNLPETYDSSLSFKENLARLFANSL